MSTKNIFLAIFLGLSVANSYANENVHETKTVYGFFDSIRSHFLPTEEEVAAEKIKLEYLAKELQVLKATQAINKCLVRFQTDEKNDQGLPAQCKKECQTYEEEAGSEAFEKVRNAYSTYISRN
jgi:hypothetical protein